MGAVMTAIWPIQTKPGTLACNLSVWRRYLGLMHFLWTRCSLVVMPQAAPHLAHAAKSVEQHLQIVSTKFVVSCMW